jgi:hypothetical protein
MMAEVMNAAKLAPVSMTQTQAVAQTATVPTSHLEARVTELEALVRNMTKKVTPTGNGSNFNRSKTRTCCKCGVVGHISRYCPKIQTGQGAGKEDM